MLGSPHISKEEETQRCLLEIAHVIYLRQIRQDITLCGSRMLLNEKPGKWMDALLFDNLIHGTSVNTDLANDFWSLGAEPEKSYL